MNRKLLITAVAAAMCVPALAAFDDQGMEYISASEGLSGSMRINIFKDSDEENSGVESGIDSLRIYYTGSADLGGGLRSTYYWELRENSDDGPEGNVYTEAFDLGITGAFGSFNVGRLGGVAPRLVPGGSLDAAVGSEHANYSPDPGANGLRYESNDINGFQLGLSAELVDRLGADPSVDGINAAVKYVSPIGLQLGLAYETEACWNASYSAEVVGAQFRHDDPAERDGAQNVDSVPVKCGAKYDASNGFRFGARYGQDNWLLAYEYRYHDNFDGNLGADGYGTIIGDLNGASPDANAVLARPSGFYDNREDTNYQVHRVAAQVKLDKFTFSANVSTEQTEIVDDFTIDADPDLDFSDKRRYGRDKIGVDVSYALGSKSSIILGWGSVESEKAADVFADTTEASTYAQVVETVEIAETLLRYRVDF